MKVFGYCAEIIRSNGLKLTRCHGHYLHQDFRRLLYCMEKAKGQVKVLTGAEHSMMCPDNNIIFVNTLSSSGRTKVNAMVLVVCA